MTPLMLLAALGWFWMATAPTPANCPQCNRQTAPIGPYNSKFGCKDWLGSALYLHGPLCHDHPNGANCAPIGNGFAYPTGTPYPPPEQIPSSTCFQLDILGEAQGQYFLKYDGDGRVEVVRGGNKKRLKAAKSDVVGSGSFFVGDTHE